MEQEPTAQGVPGAKVEPQKSLLNEWSLEIMGGLAGVFSGLIAAWKSIDKFFYRDAEQYNAKFLEIKQRRDGKFKELYTTHSGTKDKQKLYEGIKEIKGDYKRELTTHLHEDLGLHNAWDRFRTLKGHQQLEVLLAASGVTVALGAIVGLVSSRRNAASQIQLEQRLDSLENSGQQR